MSKYLWLIPFISFLSGYFVMNRLYRAKTTETPALVGKNIQEALRITASKGLSIHLTDEQEDPEIPAGTVVSQNPLPKTHIKTHQAIHCTVSKKIEHKAPQLVGKKLEDIKNELKDSDITLKVYYITSTAPEELCIAQNPAPNTAIPNKLITIYVCQGNSQSFLFPDLRQKTIAEVQEFLASAPVVIQITHTQEQSEGHSCNQCIVSEQRPRAGSIVRLDKQKPIQVQLIATPVDNTVSAV